MGADVNTLHRELLAGRGDTMHKTRNHYNIWRREGTWFVALWTTFSLALFWSKDGLLLFAFGK